METKETWIVGTMDALDGITRAESDPFIVDKVLQRIHRNQPEILKIKTNLIWKLAACIAVLISFNLFSLIYLSRTRHADQIKVYSVAAEYFSYIDTYHI